MPVKDFKVYMRYIPSGNFTATGKFVMNLNVYDTPAGEFHKKWRMTLWEEKAEAFLDEYGECEEAKFYIKGHEFQKSYEKDGETVEYWELRVNRIWELDDTENEMNTAVEVNLNAKNSE